MILRRITVGHLSKLVCRRPVVHQKHRLLSACSQPTVFRENCAPGLRYDVTSCSMHTSIESNKPTAAAAESSVYDLGVDDTLSKHKKKSLPQNFDGLKTVEELLFLHKASYEQLPGLIDTVVRDLVEMQCFDEALMLLKGISEHGIPIQSVTYSLILHQFIERFKCSNMSVDVENQFVQFIQHMTSKGYTPVCDQHFQILRMAALVGEGDLAGMCFQRLQSSEKHDVEVLRSLVLQSYFKEAEQTARYEKGDAVVRYLHEFVDQGFVPSTVLMNDFVKYSVHGKFVDATEDIMLKVLNEAASAGQVDLAKICLKFLTSSQDYHDEEVLHTLMLQSFFKEAQRTDRYDKGDEIVRFVNRVLDLGFQPSRKEMMNFVEYSVHGKFVEEALLTIEQLTTEKKDILLKYLDHLQNGGDRVNKGTYCFQSKNPPAEGKDSNRFNFFSKIYPNREDEGHWDTMHAEQSELAIDMEVAKESESIQFILMMKMSLNTLALVTYIMYYA